MSRFRCFLVAAPLFLLFGCGHRAVQVGFGVQYGPEPICPYGYFDYAPYACAPYGYYGPGWFHGGVFIGAGPWFHGPAHFYGHVDNHFDPNHGYHGPMPRHGERPAPEHPPGHVQNFHGNEMRDGRGHTK